jgi:hypothetical protein
MEPTAWIKGKLRDDVGMNGGSGQHATPIVQLSTQQSSQGSRRSNDATAGRAANIRLGIFKRNAECNFRRWMIQQPKSRDAPPNKAGLIVDIDVLREKEVARNSG